MVSHSAELRLVEEGPWVERRPTTSFESQINWGLVGTVGLCVEFWVIVGVLVTELVR